MILIIDDLRDFKDDRPALVARTSADGIKALQDAKSSGTTITELWLDHDLGILASGEEDDIKPVILELEGSAVWDDPYPIEHIFVHTSNPVGADMIVSALSRHYSVSRVFAGDQLIQH